VNVWNTKYKTRRQEQMNTFQRRYSRSHSDHELDDDFQARHTVTATIGRGSFGTVSLIRFRRKGSRNFESAAMKVASLEKMSEKDRDQAKVEVAHLADLKHPNIIGYFESFILNKELYIVMEYADGGSMDRVVREHKEIGTTLPTSKVKRWFTELLLAVGFVHSHKRMHRDIKIGNIFLHRDSVKLGDFGLARTMEGTMDMISTQVGTPYYLAPELMEGAYSYPADVWACGVVLYELCTCRRPFPAQNMFQLMRKITANEPDSMAECDDDDLKKLRTRMMHTETQDRPSVRDAMELPWIQHELDMMSGGSTPTKLRHSPATTSASASAPSLIDTTITVTTTTPVGGSSSSLKRLRPPLTPPPGPPPPGPPPPLNTTGRQLTSSIMQSGPPPPALRISNLPVRLTIQPPPLAASNSATSTVSTDNFEADDEILSKSSVHRNAIAENNPALQLSNRRRFILANGGATTISNVNTSINNEDGNGDSTDVLARSNAVAGPVKPNFLLDLKMSTDDNYNKDGSPQREIGQYGRNPFAAACEDSDDNEDSLMRRLSQMLVNSPEKAQESILGGSSSQTSSSGEEEEEVEVVKGVDDLDDVEDLGHDHQQHYDTNDTKENDHQHQMLVRHDSMESSFESMDGGSSNSSSSMNNNNNNNNNRTSMTRMSSDAPTYAFRFSLGDQQKGTPPRMSFKNRISGAHRSSLLGETVETGEDVDMEEGIETVVEEVAALSSIVGLSFA
jgi:serine/threonine protein kinase